MPLPTSRKLARNRSEWSRRSPEGCRFRASRRVWLVSPRRPPSAGPTGTARFNEGFLLRRLHLHCSRSLTAMVRRDLTMPDVPACELPHTATSHLRAILTFVGGLVAHAVVFAWVQSLRTLGRKRRRMIMTWSGSWNGNRTLFTGTYAAPDGSTFTGTWTAPTQGSGESDPPHPPTPTAPPLSDYDPYTNGMGPRVDDSDSTHR
jgi:hypothetical protein